MKDRIEIIFQIVILIVFVYIKYKRREFNGKNNRIILCAYVSSFVYIVYIVISMY